MRYKSFLKWKTRGIPKVMQFLKFYFQNGFATQRNWFVSKLDGSSVKMDIWLFVHVCVLIYAGLNNNVEIIKVIRKGKGITSHLDIRTNYKIKTNCLKYCKNTTLPTNTYQECSSLASKACLPHTNLQEFNCILFLWAYSSSSKCTLLHQEKKDAKPLLL